MRKVLFCAMILMLGRVIVRADSVPSPMPISNVVDHAEAIVVASVMQFSSDPAPAPMTLPHVVTSASEFPALMAMRQGGVYRFKSIQALKGVREDNIEMRLPMLSSFYYDMNHFDVPIGGRVLLLLKKGQRNQWTVVDPLVPLIPLSAAQAPKVVATNPAGKIPDVIDVLLGSLADDTLRPLLVHILRDVKDERVLAVMRGYADDENRKVRSDALYCLAVNQDVSAIPKIARMESDLEKNQSGHSPVHGLALYRTPAAIPYLNPLVAEGTDFTRQNAMDALAPMADKTSIPFLIRALDNDDRQQLVAESAYDALHRLVPSLGPARMRADFLAHEDAEIAVLKQWWEWEQVKAKKAAATQTQPAASSTAPATAPVKP